MLHPAPTGLSAAEKAKHAAASAAAALVENDMRVGLGTGSTADWLVKILAQRIKNEGIFFKATATSSRTATLAQSLGIEVVTLDQLAPLDLTIDGADEFDPAFTLIKGAGGALLQEKIVACASRRMVVIADPSKQVEALGAFPLPVEVIPFGLNSSRQLIEKALEKIGYSSVNITERRTESGPLYRTDEGNHILDLHLENIPNAALLSQNLNQVPGVVENGLFIDICDTVILGYETGESRTLVAAADGSRYTEAKAQK